MANEEIRLANIDTVLKTALHLFIENGINNTTREMLARASGLSRRSTERYFPTKCEFVVQAAVWFANDLYEQMHSVKMLDQEQYTAAELMQSFLEELRDILLNDTRIFACYAEFKAYLYRNSEHRYDDYQRFMEAAGWRRSLQRIFERGLQDGTVTSHHNPEASARYMTNTILSYFSNVVLLYDTKPDLVEQYINTYVNDTLRIYCGG
jgi:AcrR family transcriptional regulator